MKVTKKASGLGRHHYWRAGAPTGRMTAHPSKNRAKEQYVSMLMAGVLLFATVSNANHMASKVPNGLDTVVKAPGYNVGIKLRYVSLTAIRTTSTTTSTPGAKPRSVLIAADTTPRDFRLKSQKGLLLDTQKKNLYQLIAVSMRSKWLLGNLRRTVNASGPVAPPARARDICPKR